MYEIVSLVDDLIREISEILYYRKKERYTEIDDVLGLISYNLRKLDEKIREYKDETLEILFCENIQNKDWFERSFLKGICKIKEYILNNYNVNPIFYYEKNLESLNSRDKELSEHIKNEAYYVDNKKRKYDLEWNRVLDVSLAIESDNVGKINICSFGNPWQEAMLYAEGVDDETEKCIVFGFGLGYHIQEMAKMHPNMDIYVIENDIRQINIAVCYRNILDIINNEKVHLIYCKNILDYAEAIGDNINYEDSIAMECRMWTPSIKAIEDEELRELLERYKLTFFSMKYFKDILEENFEQNQLLNDEYVTSVRHLFEGKDVILIAAGPSFDLDVENLKKLLKSRLRSEICVLCVGKMCRRLIKEDIIPDFIIMTDANKNTKWQISGVEDSGIPLIYISTVASDVAREYKGKRYIAYQKDFEKSEQAALTCGYPLFETGGSVATFAIDIALKFKCNRLICVGLDMGYSGEKTHAGEIGRKIVNKNSLRQIEAVGGGKAYTNKNLEIYRKWIEKRISGEEGVTIINASHGARIKGMCEQNLTQIYNLD